MLEIKGVKKSYGEFQLDCSLNVEKGRITGLVGENGAGKSTLFKAMLGLISYDGGEIKIMGKTPEQLGEKEKEELGVVLAEAGFSGYLKGRGIFFNRLGKNRECSSSSSGMRTPEFPQVLGRKNLEKCSKQALLQRSVAAEKGFLALCQTKK